MTLTLGVAAGAALFAGTPAQAEAKIYAVPTHENYCPAGLQPITISGVVCCGVPNQHQSYGQMMKHPAPRKVHHKPVNYSARPDCREGIKGCS
ncbi:hypothetical protein [Roseovarius nanhaiticus]|nr:hypothetical protein [Roseovarius nanhaiticus]